MFTHINKQQKGTKKEHSPVLVYLDLGEGMTMVAPAQLQVFGKLSFLLNCKQNTHFDLNTV